LTQLVPQCLLPFAAELLDLDTAHLLVQASREPIDARDVDPPSGIAADELVKQALQVLLQERRVRRHQQAAIRVVVAVEQAFARCTSVTVLPVPAPPLIRAGPP
jgi:hypothetical protein